MVGFLFRKADPYLFVWKIHLKIFVDFLVRNVHVMFDNFDQIIHDLLKLFEQPKTSGVCFQQFHQSTSTEWQRQKWLGQN